MGGFALEAGLLWTNVGRSPLDVIALERLIDPSRSQSQQQESPEYLCTISFVLSDWCGCDVFILNLL